MSLISEAKIKNIDHLGIVAGLIDEIGIVETINSKLGIDPYKREDNQEKESEITRERPIIITKGYSRDHRPDLKQCVLDLITSSDGDIPLLMRAGDGNEADKAVFGKILVEFKKQINFDSIMVCDSALYSQENLQLIEHLKWI